MSPRDTAILESVFDVVDFGLVVLDAQMRVLEWNGWMEAVTGKKSEAACGTRLEDLFPGFCNDRLVTAVSDALTAGSSSILSSSLHAAVFPLKTRTGRLLIHNVVVRPLNGSPPRCLVQITDVTVAVERERMLRERQNARYNAVVDSAADAILTVDTKGVILHANPAAAHEFGYTATEFTKLSILVLFDAQPSWHTAWNSLLAGGRLSRPIELVTRKKDGSSSFVELAMATWHSNARIFITAILRNVDERHRAEAALRHINQTLEQKVAERTEDRDRMWRLSSDVMLVAQLDGMITAFNPAWGEMLGQSTEKSRQETLADTVLGEDLPKLRTVLRDLIETRAHGQFELRHKAHDGAIRRISWSAIAADNLLQAVGRDVTAEREAEQALQAAGEALRQSQKMEAIGQLTGGIAHDFNNLLAGILGSLELLETRLIQGRYTNLDRYIVTAKNSTNRAAALTHRLLAFSRRQTLDPKPTDLNRLIGDMDDLIRRTVGPAIKVLTRLEPALGSTLVDTNQLENALLNLCINARDAMPAGGELTIETCNLPLDEDAARQQNVPKGAYVMLSVSDTGSGMSEDVIEHAFDPFFTTKPLGEGTGLGLSMVYGFVRQSGGEARILSEIGHGTAVHLYLLRHDEVEEPREVGQKSRSTQRAPKGETVLVVDDEPSVRMLVTDVLADLGYNVIDAHDGAAGLAHLQSKAVIDLLVTDVGLPGGINGRQLADAALSLRPKLKVLFITGYAESSVVGHLKAKMYVLTKPFAIEALASKIEGILIGS